MHICKHIYIHAHMNLNQYIYTHKKAKADFIHVFSPAQNPQNCLQAAELGEAFRLVTTLTVCLATSSSVSLPRLPLYPVVLCCRDAPDPLPFLQSSQRKGRQYMQDCSSFLHTALSHPGKSALRTSLFDRCPNRVPKCGELGRSSS